MAPISMQNKKPLSSKTCLLGGLTDYVETDSKHYLYHTCKHVCTSVRFRFIVSTIQNNKVTMVSVQPTQIAHF